MTIAPSATVIVRVSGTTGPPTARDGVVAAECALDFQACRRHTCRAANVDVGHALRVHRGHRDETVDGPRNEEVDRRVGREQRRGLITLSGLERGEEFVRDL